MSREQQIVEAIRQLYAEGSTEFTIHEIRGAHTRHPEHWAPLPDRWEPLVGAVLRTLESTGAVRASGAGSYKLLHPIEPKFDLARPAPGDDAPADEPQQRPPGNRPPDVPPGSADGGGGDGAGAGYREVLSHPSLFSSMADDFNRLLARIGGRS
ncbi:hypothetical protein [Paraburkholderia sp. MM5384-R2]|uniref:hypothetical protein n=1 Tax=Paraburkholderia sp. MM5384-R2 TaxID=2723097 RepID=UPI001621CAAD|nr:hypothetical protein [Paraburkholderia sp. MM5384-R2]MBB5503249.1 hypothetical protein [Paraburkholderia sp. MM5384-R2]